MVERHHSTSNIPPLIQLMDASAQLTSHEVFSEYVKDIGVEELQEFYRQMVIVRRFDDEATALQRQGQLSLWVPSRGQEAAQVASGFALSSEDYVVPSYREHALAFSRGIPLEHLMPFFRGSGTCGWDIKKHRFHPYTVVLAAQVPQAVGYAMGLKRLSSLQSDSSQPAVAVYFGDGSSTEGDVHESMVFAASYDAPVLFFVQNNRWAISVPFTTQSRVPIATRAQGYGFEGLRVDGNDVLAVVAATRYALEKIRAGEGPVLIEAETYRLGAHTTADDPTKYREEQELQEYLALDPLIRLEKHLRNYYAVADSFFEQVQQEASTIAQRVRDYTLNSEPEDFEKNFDNVYAQPHAQTEADRAFYREYVEGFEDED
ncbi:thiamine pyrophosphate-dependent enzyme [Rothia sp. P6271]|uniref:thiamine pyrophosphate-dependent enzyme n=1 Tax=unclassified Rothia (in: high G+C Gram-positive bacteria) TaxID=2689056 RepID=UPI003AC33438